MKGGIECDKNKMCVSFMVTTEKLAVDIQNKKESMRNTKG